MLSSTTPLLDADVTEGLKHELRNAETIRAYLDELMRLKVPVQLWLSPSDPLPFETTIEKLTIQTFTTTTTPALVTGHILTMAFMLDEQRFTTYAKVVDTGVFAIPQSIAQGERRAEPRGHFDAADRAEAFAVEEVADVFPGGRFLLGKLLGLCSLGLRLALEETGTLTGPGRRLARGDRLGLVRITGLPHLPDIHCRGTIAHVTASPTGEYAGVALEGLSEADQANLRRILARRVPASFGLTFPARKLKTDVADRPGTPTKTKVKAREPEVVELPPAPVPEPEPGPERPHLTPAMRIRKSGRKVLVLSAHPSGAALAEAFRRDGFKRVFEARTFLEAKTLARQMPFDLVVLDVQGGGSWGPDLLKALRSHELLVETPLILVADGRSQGTLGVARELDAVHIHERRSSYEDLVPVLYDLVLANR